MRTKNFLIRPLAVAALFAISGVSQAALTVFNTAGSFAAATMSPGVDNFSSLSTTAVTASPTSRTAGVYTYTASATTHGFLGGGTVRNPSLSTVLQTDSITFSNFTGGAMAIGGRFYDTNAAGDSVPGEITLVATDSFGAKETKTLSGWAAFNFHGFLSDGTITSLVVTARQPRAARHFPTVDNLRIAMSAVPPVPPVPEPETYALMLAGLGAVGFLSRRRFG